MEEGARSRKSRRNRAAIVVLGDIGRSPRMQYHALSLANQAGLDVDVVAYAGSEPHAALINHPRIQLHLMRSPLPQRLPRALYLLALPVKVITQIFMLLWILCVRIPAPDLFLVQNPPSIPALSVVRWVSRVRKAAFIIDWHNFGYTILGLSLGATHPLVKLYLWYERRYGRMADGYLCVTKAMQHELAQNWGIQATVLYDRSPDFFHSTSVEEKHELYGRLQDNIINPLGIEDCCSGAKMRNEGRVTSSQVAGGQPRAELTLFTECQMTGSVCLREDRPAIVISSTSWTADEDFGILLEAAVCYDRRVGALLGELDSSSNETLPISSNQGLYPRLLIIVTGKGPMREEYERRIRRLRLRRVAFRTMWVAAEDYPLLLGSADLGVCLHTSSSGLDLPMKVVDMFGCGLPVCAVSYSCIEELVKNHVNGLLFSSSLELADQFLDLFKGFPHDCHLLNELREGALNCGSSSRWADEWECQVLPIISKVTCP